MKSRRLGFRALSSSLDSTVLYPYLISSINKDINFSRYRTTIDYVQVPSVPLNTASRQPFLLSAEGLDPSLASDKRVHDYPSTSGQLHFNDVSSLIWGCVRNCHFFWATTAKEICCLHSQNASRVCRDGTMERETPSSVVGRLVL